MTVNLSGKAVSALALAVFLGGCAVSPQPMGVDERNQLIKTDLSLLYKDQEPVTGPMTLNDVTSRALRYNLDHRLQQMQKVMEERQLDLASFDLLPKAMAQAGYTVRDKETESTSLLVDSGTESGQPSTSVERKRDTRSLAFSWNVLDFGVSYFQAKQSANRVLMAEERRRRVMQKLSQDIRAAFWAAYAAQEAEPEIRTLLTRVNQALTDAERIERDRLMPGTQILTYRQGLIEQAQQLESILGDMVRSRVQLAALINANPATPITLVADTNQTLPELKGSPGELEIKALENRPELIEARYETRNSALEARKLLARLMPGIEFGAGYYYDSNKYLVNNDWTEGSLQVSWNLLNILRYSDQKAYAKAQADVIDAKRLALTMAVIAQVHVAWHDYAQARHQSEMAQSLVSIGEGLRAQVAAKSRESAGSQLDDIRSASALVLTKLQARRTRARAMEAQAMLESSIGNDPVLPATTAAAPVPKGEADKAL